MKNYVGNADNGCSETTFGRDGVAIDDACNSSGGCKDGFVTPRPTGNPTDKPSPMPIWPTFCGIDSSDLEPYLNPPEEITSLLGLTIGSMGWGISPLNYFSRNNEACKDLNTIFNSPEDFITIHISGQSELSSTINDRIDSVNRQKKLLIGDASEDKICKRKSSRCKTNPSLNPLPSVSDLVSFLPMCVALRPCNAANEMGKRITFGLIVGTSGGGDGILVCSYAVLFLIPLTG